VRAVTASLLKPKGITSFGSRIQLWINTADPSKMTFVAGKCLQILSRVTGAATVAQATVGVKTPIFFRTAAGKPTIQMGATSVVTTDTDMTGFGIVQNGIGTLTVTSYPTTFQCATTIAGVLQTVSVSSASFDMSKNFMVGYVWDTANWTFYNNGVLVNTGATAAASSGCIYMTAKAYSGGNSATGRFYEQGHTFNRSTGTGRSPDAVVYEMVVIDGAISSTDRQLIECSLRASLLPEVIGGTP
jgi:hypothetical protein